MFSSILFSVICCVFPSFLIAFSTSLKISTKAEQFSVLLQLLSDVSLSLKVWFGVNFTQEFSVSLTMPRSHIPSIQGTILAFILTPGSSWDNLATPELLRTESGFADVKLKVQLERRDCFLFYSLKITCDK